MPPAARFLATTPLSPTTRPFPGDSIATRTGPLSPSMRLGLSAKRCERALQEDGDGRPERRPLRTGLLCLAAHMAPPTAVERAFLQRSRVCRLIDRGLANHPGRLNAHQWQQVQTYLQILDPTARWLPLHVAEVIETTRRAADEQGGSYGAWHLVGAASFQTWANDLVAALEQYQTDCAELGGVRESGFLWMEQGIGGAEAMVENGREYLYHTKARTAARTASPTATAPTLTATRVRRAATSCATAIACNCCAMS